MATEHHSCPVSTRNIGNTEPQASIIALVSVLQLYHLLRRGNTHIAQPFERNGGGRHAPRSLQIAGPSVEVRCRRNVVIHQACGEADHVPPSSLLPGNLVSSAPSAGDIKLLHFFVRDVFRGIYLISTPKFLQMTWFPVTCDSSSSCCVRIQGGFSSWVERHGHRSALNASARPTGASERTSQPSEVATLTTPPMETA